MRTFAVNTLRFVIFSLKKHKSKLIQHEHSSIQLCYMTYYPEPAARSAAPGVKARGEGYLFRTGED